MMKGISILVAGLICFASCKNTNGDTAQTSDAKEVAAHTGTSYTIDQESSSLKWTATHKGGLNPRYGYVKAAGTVSVENNTVTGGAFTIDMNTFSVDSNAVAASEGKKSSDLEGHLKSADFFDVAQFPQASFEITGVTPFDSATVESVIEGATNIVSGNLTLKGKKINVTFPAKINITDSEIDVESKFIIDRSAWGISYKAEGNPADWGISKDVLIEMNIKAKK